MAAPIEGNIWVELDRMSREYLSKRALMAQQAEINRENYLMQATINAAESQLARAHDKRLKDLEVSRVLYDQKWQQIETKKSALQQKANESRVARLAFEALPDKDNSGTDAFSLVDSYKREASDEINNEIQNLNRQLVELDARSNQFYDNLLDLEEGAAQLEGLALMTTPAQGYYTASDIEGLVTDVPTIEGKKIGVGEMQTAISNYSAQNLDPSEIGTYDLNRDGKVDVNDSLYLNALDELGTTFGEDTALGRDALGQLKDMYQSSAQLKELNQSLYAQKRIDPTSGANRYFLAQHAEGVEQSFGSVLNQLLVVDSESGARSINPQLKLQYSTALKDQGIDMDAYKEISEGFDEVVNFVTGAEDGADLLERIDLLNPQQLQVFENLKSLFPGFRKSIENLQQNYSNLRSEESKLSGAAAQSYQYNPDDLDDSESPYEKIKQALEF